MVALAFAQIKAHPRSVAYDRRAFSRSRLSEGDSVSGLRCSNRCRRTHLLIMSDSPLSSQVGVRAVTLPDAVRHGGVWGSGAIGCASTKRRCSPAGAQGELDARPQRSPGAICSATGCSLPREKNHPDLSRKLTATRREQFRQATSGIADIRRFLQPRRNRALA